MFDFLEIISTGWIEHMGHNEDYRTFFKIDSQWYEVHHDAGVPSYAAKTTEEGVIKEFKDLEKYGRLVQEGWPKPGQRFLCLSDGTMEDFRENDTLFHVISTSDDENDIPVLPKDIAKWVNEGIFDKKIAELEDTEINETNGA